MWDVIGQVLTSSNGIIIAILLIIVVVIATKYGLIKVKTDKVTIGRESSENERVIIRQQNEYVEWATTAFERQIPKFEGYDRKRGELIVALIRLEINNWITQNHIKTTSRYVTLKQDQVWNIVQANTIAEAMEGDEFHEQVNTVVEQIITALVAIRKEYS